MLIPMVPSTETAASEIPEAAILGEDTGKREKNIKHFLKEDMSFTAAVYPNAVHYKENGKWEDIDNSLAEGVDEEAVPFLENKKNVYKVRIAKNSNARSLVNIKKGIHEIGWNLIGGDKAKVVMEVPETFAPQEKGKEKLDLRNLQSTARYNGILPGIDLEYHVLAEEVKENIIIREKMAVAPISFSLYLKNMVPKLTEGNRIVFHDAASGEAVMEMPAPFMMDSIGEASYDVALALTEVKAGSEYTLTLTPDNTWLQDGTRVYPVIIDPIVRTTLDYTKIFDASVTSASPDTNYRDFGVLKTGYGSTSGVNRTYLSFTLPVLTTADFITEASIKLRTYTSSVDQRQIEMYKVNAAWNSGTITWNNKPAYNSGKKEEFQLVNGSSGSTFNFDITGIVKEWYTTGVNNGLMVKNANETNSGLYTDFHSSDTTQGSTYRPQITIGYLNNSGLEDYWTYHAQSIGRAGTAHVNDYNGNLILLHGDTSSSGSRMPVSVNHVFNSNEISNTPIGYGLGWRLNLSQTVVPNVPISGYHAYTDEDGTIHYFVLDSATGKYVEESGINLSMTINTASTTARYVITDKGGNTLTFNSSGKLVTIKDLQNNTAELEYGTNGALWKVRDGALRVTEFVTDAAKTLLAIKDPAQRTTSFGYTSGKLTSITYPDGKVSNYTYDAAGKLLSAKSPDGYMMSYAYYGIAPYRVQKITESHSGGTLGAELSLSYGYNMTTFTDVSGRKNVYQFNDLGNTVSVKDHAGQAAYYGYGTSGTVKNKLTLESKLQGSVMNHLRNHSAENTAYWNLEQLNGASGTMTYATDFKYVGNQSLKVVKSGIGGTVFTSNHVILPKGKTYTLSAYMKTSGVTSGNCMGALIVARYQDATGWKYAYGKYVSGTNDWDRVEVTFTIPSNAISGDAFASLGIEGESGTAWFDAVQIEEGSVANRYNLLQNADMAYGTGTPDYWVKNAATEAGDGLVVTADTNHPATLNKNVLKITGSPTRDKGIMQTVKVSGKAGDPYVVGGWAKAASVPLTSGPGRKFGIAVGFKPVSGGAHSWYELYFSEDSTDWQYLMGTVIPNVDFSEVDYYVIYQNNLNTSYFDGLQLYREEYGQSFQYDDKGNVISTSDLARQKSTFEYNTSSDLVKSIDPKGSSFLYEYTTDGKRNLTKATSAENVVYSFEYDAYGNAKKATVGTGSVFMASNATYTASGNYVQSVTDSAGNVVTYSYDETKGNLSSVTDPKNSIAAYTYDANTDALTGVSKSVEGSTVSNTYTYLNDRLRTITHNGFSYTFSYDVLGNPTTVSAGTQNLVTNSYESRTGKLLESTYGNGHKVAKDYDNLDRAVAYKVWNSATGQYEVKFRYGYDDSGNLGYKEDLVNNTSYRYVYDLAERLVKITGTDGSSLTNGFDVNNNVSSITEKGNGTSFTTGYEYDKDNRPLKVTLQNGATGTNTYDSLGRVSLSRVTIGAAIFDVSYSYIAGVNGSTTARVATISNSNGNAIAYTYDQNGNIETITEGSKLTKYSYNELNEVIREDNGNLNKSITYTYDAGGNILTKKEYAYTTGVLGTVISTIPYTYGDANWKDKLTSYNGKAISYDAIGNPQNYDGWTYTWENGRQLKSLGNGSTSLSFKYDDAGVRTEKTVNGITTKYTLFGDKVSFETTGSDKIHYSYDASGNLFSMNLNGSEYYYTRNAQGDITGLIDGAKNQVVSYTYDTWGKLISTTGSLAGTLGLKNPYRYRGYRYDTESGLYYLQSRYYNPDWGRFVNADDGGILEIDQNNLIENNLFVYVMNNPVNMEDSSGYFAVHIVAGIVIGSGFEYITQRKSGNQINLAKVVLSGVIGGGQCSIRSIFRSFNQRCR